MAPLVSDCALVARGDVQAADESRSGARHCARDRHAGPSKGRVGVAWRTTSLLVAGASACNTLAVPRSHWDGVNGTPADDITTRSTGLLRRKAIAALRQAVHSV